MNKLEFNQSWSLLEANFKRGLPDKFFILKRLQDWPDGKFKAICNVLIEKERPPILCNFLDQGNIYNANNRKLIEKRKSQVNNFIEAENEKWIKEADEKIALWSESYLNRVNKAINHYTPRFIQENSKMWLQLSKRMIAMKEESVSIEAILRGEEVL